MKTLISLPSEYRRSIGERLTGAALASILVLGATGCSAEKSSSSSDSAESMELSLALEVVQETVNNVGDLKPGSGRLATGRASQRGVNLLTASGFGSDWASGSDFALYPNPNSDTGSAQSYIQQQLDTELQDNGDKGNVFMRLTDSLQSICGMGVLPQMGSDFYPTVGTQAITLNGTAYQTMATTCGQSVDQSTIDFLNNSPLQVNLEITQPSDTTYYDRKLYLAQNPMGEGGASNIFVRYNSDEINLVRSEDESVGPSRLLIAFDRKAQVMKLEYFQYAKSSGNLTFYRLYLDQANDVAKVFTVVGGVSTGWTRFTVAGKPAAGGTVAVSMDRHGGSFTGNFDRQACVNVADSAIASGSDNSLACSVTGADVDTVMAAVFPSGLADAATDAQATSPGWLEVSDTLAIDWDGDTVFTQPAQY